MESRSAVRGGRRSGGAAFQPIIDLRDGSVVGYEALARPRDGSSPRSCSPPRAPRAR